MDPWSILERATRALGLPVTLKDQPEALQPPMLGFDHVPPPPQVMKTLPKITSLEHFLHVTWAKHQDPPKLGFNTEFEGAPEIGIPALPSVGMPLAATLEANFFRKKGAGAKSPFLLTGDSPKLEDKTERNLTKPAKEVYRACGYTVRDLNAAGLTSAYIKQLFDLHKDLLPAEAAAEMAASIQLLINLNYHAVSWAGRAMDHVLQQESARWVAASGLGKEDPEKEELLKLPSAPTALLDGGLQVFQRRAAAREETQRLVGNPMPPPASYAKVAAKPRAPRSSSKGQGGRTPTSSGSRSSSSKPPSRTPSQGPPPQRAKEERPHPQYRSAKGRGKQQRK
jgi:hypothetical protein